MSILYSPWTSQPQQAFSADAIIAATGSVGKFCLKTNRTLTEWHGSLWTTRKIIRGDVVFDCTAHAATGLYWPAAVSGDTLDKPVTYVIQFVPLAADGYIASRFNSLGTTSVYAGMWAFQKSGSTLLARWHDGALQSRTLSGVTLTNGVKTTVVVTFANGSANAWQDGVLRDSWSYTVPSLGSTTPSVNPSIGRSAEGNNGFAGHISVFAALPARHDGLALSQNPWQIFKPIPRRIFVPVAAGGGTTLTPTTVDLIIGGKVPTFTQPNSASPAKGAPRLTGYAPTVSQTAAQVLNPAKGSIVITGKTPTIDQTAANSVLPATGHAYFTGKQPSLTQNQTIAPSKASLSTSGKVPTVTQSVAINPITGAVVITGKTPSLIQNQAISPATAHAILTGKTPTISDTTPMTDSQKIDLILDILSNRQVLDPATGIYTLYDDTGTVVLKTAQAWEDASGTIPYRGQGLKRLDAME